MKKSGILLPITSLPSKGGIGCFSKDAYEFVDLLKSAGQSYWQILPLGHTGYGNSPYGSFSAFAGNPYMVSPQALLEKELLTIEEYNSTDNGNSSPYIDYALLYKNRYPLLKRAYSRWRGQDDKNYISFCNENSFWLEDYCLFMAAKDYFGAIAFTSWENDLLKRQNLPKYKELLSKDIGFYKFIQFEFFCQWQDLKKYANSRQIEIIGDIPIYVAPDSADVWANPHLFCLDDRLIPTLIAGCPPDGFSKLGQLWGNPVYNWQANRESGYLWWKRRIAHSFRMYDILRLDHFRGFESYYTIDYGMPDAREGTWKKGPGAELFDILKKLPGVGRFIAEDLGFITDEVRALLKHTGFMGMKILEFAFDTRDGGASEEHLPCNYPPRCVAYTGTHDNEPLSSWFGSLPLNSREDVRLYLGDYRTPDNRMYRPLIESVMMSRADMVILPLWDVLGLGGEARINTPGTVGNNWRWRLTKNSITEDSIDFLKSVTRESHRSNIS